MKIGKRAAAFGLALLIGGSAAAGAAPAGMAAAVPETLSQVQPKTDRTDYADYRRLHAGETAPSGEIRLDIAAVQTGGDTQAALLPDGKGIALPGDTGELTFTFSAPESGMYTLEFDYASGEPR